MGQQEETKAKQREMLGTNQRINYLSRWCRRCCCGGSGQGTRCRNLHRGTRCCCCLPRRCRYCSWHCRRCWRSRGCHRRPRTRLAQGEQLRWASHRVLVRDGEWRAGGTGVEDALWGWVIAVSDLELHPASVSTGQKGKRTYRMRLVGRSGPPPLQTSLR